MSDVKVIAEKLGFETFNPMQAGSLTAGLLECNRFVTCAPTASGKTLLALLKIVDNYEKTKLKAVYVVPLKALANEKFDELTERLQPFGMKVAVSTGDLDGESESLAAFDVIIVTSEKMDSLLRHKTHWTEQIGLIVLDEVHLIDDETRGPTLEVVITKMHVKQNIKILALSATVPNAQDLANWLKANLYKSDYRSTKLVKGVAAGDVLEFQDDQLSPIHLNHKKPLETLIEKGLDNYGKNGQVLIFVGTRRNAESTAKDITKLVSSKLHLDEKQQCNELARKALKALPTPTSQCKLLSECLAAGVAFHHAGIESKQQKLIEQGFKHDRSLKVIVATTTLAMGIDYPAAWVIVKDLKRFQGHFSDFIPAIEVAQMTGRAGRPRYYPTGIAVLQTQEKDGIEVWDKYVYGELENIYSKLSSEPALRMHCLELVASAYCASYEQLFTFFSSTFYSYQYGNQEAIIEKIEGIVQELVEMDFLIEKNGKLGATPVGKRVSELYLDPLTAFEMLKFMTTTRERRDIDYLFLISSTSEMRPLVNTKKNEEEQLFQEAQSSLDDFPVWRPNAIEEYKTAKVINSWINEENENQILELYGLPPGILHGKMKIAEWLMYSLAELAYTKNQTTTHVHAKKLTRRLRKGIKEELLPLTRVKGIGRVKARRLFDKGIRTTEQLQNLTKDEVQSITKGEKAEQKRLSM